MLTPKERFAYCLVLGGTGGTREWHPSIHRNGLSPVHLEQITVITMFIKNFGWSQEEMIEWLNGMLPRARLKAAADKEASIPLNN